MKSRFTCLDVHAACTELAPQVIDARVQNIYDINGKSFLFKLNPKEGDDKIKLVIESGVRLHRTAYDFETSNNSQPSFFAMKLRKWLRDRRVTGFGQCGFDRVVRMDFGHVNPELALHLYLEFYSAGNVILTDWKGTILLILRVVSDKEGNPLQKLGMAYELPLSDSLGATFDKLEASVSHGTIAGELKKVVKEKFGTFGGPMISHLVHLMASGLSAPEAIRAFRDQLIDAQGTFEGYLTLDSVGEEEEAFVDFLPHPLNTGVTGPVRTFPSFNEAVDEFFSKIELQKGQRALQQQEKDAVGKLEAIRLEQNNRIAGLEATIQSHLDKALAIDADPEEVQKVILVVKAALDAGMDWTEFQLVITEEKKKGTQTALIIEKLNLAKNLVTITLNNTSVDIDVKLTPHANATRQYELRRQAQEKLERTRVALDKALKSAERKIRADLKSSRSKAKRQQVFAKRKHFWFEKFNWFVSSDGFLVLAGRDMQQNELLVKRYLREGDIYAHADMHGASSVIIKGRRSVNGIFLPIPHRTLAEAGSMSLCNSRAWEAKIVTSAWWVHAAQVSKTAPSGEFLPTGSFMIRGKKNFLAAAQLLYGFGFTFFLDEEGREKNKAARLAFDQQLASMTVDPSDGLDKYVGMLEINAEEPVEEVNVTSNLPKPKTIPKEKSKKSKGAKEDEPMDKKGTSAKRGSKKKMVAKKYADQDEEERQARMALLASAKKKTDEPVGSKLPTGPQELKERAQRTSFPTLRKEPVVVPQEPEDEEEEEPAGEDEMAVLDSLTGNLKGNFNHALYAIPVAGPISALSTYSFRLRLMPGSLKRGKAVQQAMSILLSDARQHHCQSWLGEEDSVDCTSAFKKVKEMLRAVPDGELNQAMLGHVKIMASTKEIQKSKKELTATKKKK